MVAWKNLDTLTSFEDLAKTERVNLIEAMTGENGAERVKKYSVPMAEGFVYNYAAKQVDEEVLTAMEKLAEEAQLAEKFEALYNGEVVNTGEKQSRSSPADPRTARRSGCCRRSGQAQVLCRTAEPHCRVCK